MKNRKLTRRDFLRLSAMTTAGVVAAACARATPVVVEKEVIKEVPVEKPVVVEKEVVKEVPVEKEVVKEVPVEKVIEREKVVTATPLPAGPPKYKEAPELAELVKAGKLPPVDERLPVEPFVIGPGVLIWPEDLPEWQVGEYSREGEVLRTVTTNPTWSYPCQHALEWFLNCPKHHTGPLTGNIAKSWKVNEDCTEYELTLRKGLKWSDGEPVTTEDIRFAWEDVQLNEQITPALDAVFKSRADPRGDPMTLEIVDDYTFRYKFTEPNGRFLKSLGMGNLWDPYCALLKPKHYLQQFHTTYTPIEELKPLLEKEGLTEAEWYRLFVARGGTWWGGGCEHEAEELPVLRGWIIKPSPEESIIMERNPYYWKVDVEGQQLPYVGRIEAKVVAKPENIPAAIITGEINFCREILRHTDVALYKEHEGDAYRVNLDMVYHNAPVAFMLNYNNPDPVWQQVVLDKKFRQAVNAAINNKEIIDALYLGLGTHSTWFPAVDDPDLANKLLDEIGLDKRDAEGYRLGPDGNRFEVFMEIALDPLFVQPAELIASHLDAVGLRTSLKQLEYGLFNERRDANQLYASVDWLDDCNWPYVMYYDYMPDSRIRWGRLWEVWMRTNGEEGVEPPDWIKELYEISKELVAVNPNTKRAEEAEKRFAAWMMEYIPVFPVARDVADPVIVPPNLGNVPISGRSSALMFAQEQCFFKH